MGGNEPVSAREMAIREFNSLRGRLLAAIESVGLPREQQKSLVTLIKNLSYQNQAVIEELIRRLDPDEEMLVKFADYRLELMKRDERAATS